MLLRSASSAHAPHLTRRGACCHTTTLACLGLTKRQLCTSALSIQAAAALTAVQGASWPAQAKQRQSPVTAAIMAAGSAASRPLRIDSAVHVWAPVELSSQYPYAGQLLGAAPSSEPPMPGHADLLLESLQQASVDGALIVQPGNHLYDHSYVSSVLKAHPSKFVGCLLADPTEGGGGAAAIRQLASEGYRAVRFNPYLWPEGQLMTNKVGREMYEQAGALSLPVSHMPFKGFLRHVDEIESLIQGCPETKVIIDHFGFCNCQDLQSEEWRRLLALARYPQVHVKASAFFRVSNEQWPYEDARRGLKALVTAFGAERVIFGTDWPWITEKCSYADAWSILDGPDGAEPLLSDDERGWVSGGAIRQLFPGAWSTD